MMPVPPAVRFSVARSRESWPEAALASLEIDATGDIRLRRMPAVSPPWLHPTADAGASGLALDDACGLYVADTADDRIMRVGLDCATLLELPGCAAAPGLGVLHAPTGLAVGAHQWLFVANSGDGRVLVFSTPDLTLRDAWDGLKGPLAIACHDDMVLVVDAMRVLRFDAKGKPDAGFDALIAPPNGPADPRAIAVGPDGTIYVGDAASGRVRRFDWSGAALSPALAGGTQPRALAVLHDVLYVGDVASGTVLMLSLPDGELLGAVGGFSGPVTALAAGERCLFVKTGPDAAYLAARETSFAPAGQLTWGPLDAGEELGWKRAAVACELPPGTEALLELYVDDLPAPGPGAWRAAPALDVLLDERRYLWLRVTLSTARASVSPALLQVRAQTAGDSYLEFLPFVYGHDPDRPGLSKLTLDQADPAEYAPGDLAYLRAMYARTPPERDFLERLLDLAASELDDLDRAIADLPTLFDPATAPASMLDWLSSWLAFDLPPRLLDGAHPDEVRRLLLGLAALYRRRGTPRGVADFVEIYAGTRPLLWEDFRARPLWVLGETALGFGSGLPDRDLEGLIVGDAVVGETAPEDPVAFGAAAFASTAHRFSVIVPPAGLDDERRALIMRVAEAEKPAHTAFHLCFTEPQMRVGVQARVGLDAILAASPDSIVLGERSLVGLETRLAEAPARDGGTVGTGQLGLDTRLG
jgi:phage tail-like protein